MGTVSSESKGLRGSPFEIEDLQETKGSSTSFVLYRQLINIVINMAVVLLLINVLQIWKERSWTLCTGLLWETHSPNQQGLMLSEGTLVAPPYSSVPASNYTQSDVTIRTIITSSARLHCYLLSWLAGWILLLADMTSVPTCIFIWQNINTSLAIQSTRYWGRHWQEPN